MSDLKIYTKDYCPYCDRAKSLLKQRGIVFEEIEIDENNIDFYQALCEKSGMRTVPQIFHKERLIGGYTELAELDSKDKLSSLK